MPRLKAPVHPRVRGEHVIVGIAPEPLVGSSPRARGTPHVAGGSVHLVRFIPACAGNTPRQRPSQGLRSVHPRVRGEHLSTFAHLLPETGSSRGARGTPPTVRVSRPGGRFIPACAGNTRLSTCALSEMTVHPRVRGEHLNGGRDTESPAGSSRVRGEHLLLRNPGSGVNGSSPRARGTRAGGFDPRPRRRFIPACAGNTSASRDGGPAAPVHPRVRGEHACRSSGNNDVDGSSPRARGTPG